jgi:CheY-like chemotaxis protein
VKNARILIVEDEPSVLDAVSIILKDRGYMTRCAATGQAALREAARLKFDVAIIDLQLPDVPGLRVLESLRDLQPELSAILISAYELPSPEGPMPSGAAGSLAKPFLPATLADLVQTVLDRRDRPGHR